MPDPEIEAMTNCNDSIKDLNEDAKLRVVQWLISKFNLPIQQSKQAAGKPQGRRVDEEGGDPQNGGSNNGNSDSVENYETLAEFIADLSPNTDWERALAVASFLQINNDLAEFSGSEVNKELKDLGHASDNITRDFNLAMNRKPKLIIQMRKSGTSKQSRKKYKVSTEGIKYIKQLLKGGNNETE